MARESNIVEVASVYGAAITNTVKTLVDLGFTADQIEDADMMQLTLETADIRYTYKATDVPSTTVGHPLAFPAERVWRGNDVFAHMQFVRKTGTSAAVNVTLFRRRT